MNGDAYGVKKRSHDHVWRVLRPVMPKLDSC